MFNWLDDKHRIAVINNETFQEEKSIRIIPSVVISVFVLFIAFVIITTLLTLLYTPLGNLMPERKNIHIRNELNAMYMNIDSLEKAINDRDLFILKVRSLVFEKFEYADDIEDPASKDGDLNVDVPKKNDELLELMENVENEDQLGTLLESTFHKSSSINEMIFIPPVTGMVSDTFSPVKGHFGVDIIAPKASHIKATKKGTVIVSTFSVETGHMMAIQHDNDIISFYKHNSANLKKVGDIVNGGEVIAIIGNSGEMSDGPHLHFELWFKGQAVNPERYLQFEN